MDIDFPSDPTLSQTFDDPVSGREWIWDGEKWLLVFQPITTDQIADGAITTSKIANGAVTAEKLAPNAVPSPIPPGAISMYGGSTAPSGWLLCNGLEVSRVDYSALFAAIGTTYGVGNNTSTFNLPDLQNRFPLGYGNATWATPLGKKAGSASATLIQHNHDVGDHAHDITHEHTSTIGDGGEHDHSGNTLQNANNTGSNHYVRPLGYPADETHTVTNPGGTHSHSITVDAFSGSTSTSNAGTTGYRGVTSNGTQNLPPYIALNFIIKT